MTVDPKYLLLLLLRVLRYADEHILVSSRGQSGPPGHTPRIRAHAQKLSDLFDSNRALGLFVRWLFVPLYRAVFVQGEEALLPLFGEEAAREIHQRACFNSRSHFILFYFFVLASTLFYF